MLKSTLLVAVMSIAAAAVMVTAPDASSLDQFQAPSYRTVKVDGVWIFYREAGPPSAPTLLLLHGFPSSSRMYEPLLASLAARYHVVAPDYPGFGNSDAPPPKDFAYTFDHLAKVMSEFTEALQVSRYVLYMNDYGGPVGMRMALAHPERVRALIVQNAVAHREGLGPQSVVDEAYWLDRSAHEDKLRAAMLSLAATRERHIGYNPSPRSINPDLWVDEFAFLNRPGEADIQAELFYDYRTNVESFPLWSAWLRAHKPQTLVLWGRYDPAFRVDEVDAYKRDIPEAETHVIDAGHFAAYENAGLVARLLTQFIDRLPSGSAG